MQTVLMLKNFVNARGIKWHFHPPLGSHHGGHYERLIRSVRRVLRGITSEQEMSEDNLTTFFCEAEKILNDRPLTSLTDDPDDQTPITPNLILLLRSNPCYPLFEDCRNRKSDMYSLTNLAFLKNTKSAENLKIH